MVGQAVWCVQALLLEHNVRFGDPECQGLLSRLHSDLLPVLQVGAAPPCMQRSCTVRPCGSCASV
jgi:phosphoribosylamine-glycine ligase